MANPLNTSSNLGTGVFLPQFKQSSVCLEESFVSNLFGDERVFFCDLLNKIGIKIVNLWDEGSRVGIGFHNYSERFLRVFERRRRGWVPK